jgi:mannan endo-1,4-beta-mannosidase
VPEIANCVRVEYDLYYPVDAASGEGGVRPYAVGNPGWVKLGQDMSNMNFIDIPTEEIGGLVYAHQHVVIPTSGLTPCSELYIGAIGSLMIYEGPIYLDNIVLYEEVYVD